MSKVGRGFNRRMVPVLAVALLLVTVGVASAFADEEGSSSAPLPSSQEVGEAIESESSSSVEPVSTDPSAAEGVALQNLGRNEALELLQGVFEPELQSPAGIFDDLHVEKFLADNVAVIAPGEQPESPTEEESGEGGYHGATLMDSTVPLRTEGPSGQEEAVDLGLEHAEGELQPSNPLVEVGIPSELGEGIALPETGVTIELAGAPQQLSPSIIDQSVGFFPNVSADTDLAVAPTPTGVETLTQLRSRESPRSQTFELNLPSGASLEAKDGGAEVTRGGEELIGVAPPTALDASGAEVPVSLAVVGNSLTLTVSPEESTTFPILVDPLFQTYEWYAKKTEEGIEFGEGTGWSKREPGTETPLGGVASFGQDVPSTNLEPTVPYGTPGLYVADLTGAVAGGEAFFGYAVPRYFNPNYAHEGQEPESFISKLSVTDMDWKAESEAKSPYVYMGIWGPTTGWSAGLYYHEGLTGHGVSDMSWVYSFPNELSHPDIKLAEIGLYSTEKVTRGWTYLYVGAATVELGEPASVFPELSKISGPTAWVNQAPTPIHYLATDNGLGISSITISGEQGSSPPSWKEIVNSFKHCTGVSSSPCPASWETSQNIEPASLPTGIDNLKLVAEDPLGHVSTTQKEGKTVDAHVQIQVDHTAPTLALSGPMTEQATLGTARANYALKLTATDGTTGAPQSGIAKTVVKVDGKVVDEAAPGCTTQNCSISREWNLESSQYAVGAHTVEVTATDAVGLTTTKSLTIELHPTPPPALTLSGSMTEQATLGTTRPRYTLKASATSEAGVDAAATPTYVSSFGTAGIGNGQLSHPADVEVDSKGNLWVVDENNTRIEEFNEAGTFIKKFGTEGVENGQFIWPTALSVDAKGNVWVLDSGLSRVQEFNEAGTFIKKFGSYGTGNGQFHEPEGIAVDAKGNVWVTDTHNGRVQEFNEAGTFVKVIGSKGTGAGQFEQPTSIAIGPGGNVWITDWTNNRVEEYNEAGTYVRQFGAEGTANGQFKRPDAIAVDTRGVWVADDENGRVQEFSEKGAYIAQFGAKGSGAGQFSFSRGIGLAIDPRGDIRVTDPNNNRIQDWQQANGATSYVSAFGSLGTGNGQFLHASDIAIDSKGNVWASDSLGNRIEEFNEKGEYLTKFGSVGSANGQLSSPTALAIDSKGNVWVTDTNNNRVQEFNEKGEYVAQFGGLGGINGKFVQPEGIAIDSKGNIWVADRGNGRLQEFTEAGTFVKVVGTKGSGAGQLGEPMGIAVGPANNIWVADYSNNRVEEFTEAGTYVRQFGSEGWSNGQFLHPGAVSVDAKGNVWVVDTGNGRIEEFNEKGEYLAQFGSKGSGAGQLSLSRPVGIAKDAKGYLWSTDAGGFPIEKWLRSSSRSGVAAEITVDGKKVDSTELGCAAETCAASPEWTLASSAYEVGKHTIVAKATDGLGRTTTKTLTIEIQRDTTKPTLEASGSLFEAPEGWVEQQSYSLTGKAEDAGSGVTQMKLMIDGAQAGIATQTCVNGGCTLSHTFTVNTASYPGGAHEAELIATDGAGNTTTKKWTINVDPEGKVSVLEAEQTLEAADATSESTVVAPTSQVLEPEQIEGGDNPGLKLSGTKIESTGVPDTTTMTTNPTDGFTIESPEGTTTITPIVSESSSSVSIAEGVAGVAANVANEADSVVRPEYNGVQTFQAIRSESSPETYSWRVHLALHQKLHYVNPTQAEVAYEDGTTAFLITAEPAHDATGMPVPTSFEVSGEVLTLKVEFHSKAFVYPIVSGQGWETSYSDPVIIEGPEDETQIREREERETREREERERAQQGQESIPPTQQELGQFPEPHTSAQFELLASFGAEDFATVAPPTPGGQGKTRTVLYRSQCGASCSKWNAKVYNAGIWTANDHSWSKWESGTQVHATVTQNWKWEAVFLSTMWNCGYIGQTLVHRGEGEHLTAYGHFTIESWIGVPKGDKPAYEKNFTLLAWVYPNGYQEKHVNWGWTGQPTAHECPVGGGVP